MTEQDRIKETIETCREISPFQKGMNGRMAFSKVWNERGMKDDRKDS